MIIRLFRVWLLPPSARKPAALKNACLRTLRAEKADGPGELNIVFLDRRKMLALNKRALGHDYDTDVIAFRYPWAEHGRRAAPDEPFGDVFISARQVRVQARHLGHPALTEALTLIIHGTLHLLGYDDSTPPKRALMFRKQDRLLE